LQALDKVIEPSGMFKYQYVSTGSKYYLIITCPRAACPHDREQQVCITDLDIVLAGGRVSCRLTCFTSC